MAPNIPRAINQVYRLLAPSLRPYLPGIILLMILASLLEVVGISMIFPLIQAVVNTPSDGSGYLGFLYQLLSPASQEGFITALAVMFMLTIVIKNIVLFGVNYANTLFTRRAEIHACQVLFEHHLNVPWEEFVTRNSAETTLQLVEMVPRVFTDVLLAGLRMIAELGMAVAVCIALMVVRPGMTLAVLAIGIISTGGVHIAMKSFIARWAVERVKLLELRLKTIQQALAGLRETRVLGRTRFRTDLYQRTNERLSWISAANQSLGDLRRASIETTGAIVIAFVLVVATSTGMHGQDALAFLAVFAAGMMRLMPVATRVLMSLQSITAAHGFLDALSRSFPGFPAEQSPAPQADLSPLSRSIVCEDLHYRYPESNRLTLDSVNVEIAKGEFVGLVGPSGSGKSTLADIVLGLLQPQKGRLLVDGTDVTQAPQSWQRLIGYVPQTIHLNDDTLRRNIAYCLPDDQIDEIKVLAAAAKAQLTEFIASLPQGLDTVVGEWGVRLSGGQRQRIGIARALYDDPPVLILDEATSALDNETEKAVTDTITGLKGDKTMLVIAHRISTLKDCSRIIYLVSGKIAGQGRFEELFRTCPGFATMVRLAEMNPGQSLDETTQ